MEIYIIILLSITLFFWIFFLISWINERKVLTIILGIISVVCFVCVGYLGWQYDNIEKFQIVETKEEIKFKEEVYEFIIKSNKGNVDKVWIRKRDLETYENNSMFVEAVEKYEEDKSGV